jgi:RHS repeat-associated protein
MKGEGTITYAYDAKGLKEVKIVVDSTQNPVKTTTTLYVKNYQYSNDTLTQASFEEGRARYQKRYFLNGDSIQTYYYDYFLKDHLGNTRIILTTERDTTSYIATMEAAYRATESKLFSNIASTSFAWNSMPNESQNIPNSIRYPSGVTINDSVSKVDYNGTSGQTTGPGLLLKVMSGDAVSLGVQCYYVNNTLTTTNSSLTSVLNSLAGGIMGTPTGAAEGTLSGYTSSSGTVYSALTNFLGTNDPAPPTGYPKAYLNWILLDDQFNYVSGSSGAVAAASTTYPANQMNTVAPGGPIVMSKNGYLYVWVSNETQGWDVFFDNFSVQYRQGPVLEENHYYPFGLTMAGISDKAVKTSYVENKYRWNKGSELQNREFSDGTGLEMYATELRELDPQLGRWWQIDSKPTEAESPYSAMGNNPILHNDPLGDSIIIGSININTPKDAPSGGNIGRISLTTIDVEGKLINGSSTSYSNTDMQNFANRLNGAISSDYSIPGTSVAISNITVESANNPLQSGDHAIRLEDPGTLPGYKGSPNVTGSTPFGQNVVNLSTSILSQTPASSGQYAGTGLSASGGATLERTGAHEIGHSADLDHPRAGSAPGNLMNQSGRPDAGTKITPDQIKQMKNDFDKGKLNHGRQI